MRLWRERLLVRLLGYFLLLAIIPLAIVGALAYNRGEEALTKNVLDHLETTATLKESEINRWVEDKVNAVRTLERNPFLQEQVKPLLARDETSAEFAAAHQALDSYLNDALAIETDFLEITVLRKTGGKVLFSTNSEHEGHYELSSTYFVEGSKGTYIQNIYPSPILGEPAMTIATPLYDQDGQLIGVLAVHLDLEKLDDIMLERGGLGRTGETYLVDQYNVFVSRARFGSESFPTGAHSQGIDTALQEKRNGAGIYANYRRVPVVGAYRWLDDREMALLAEVELDEALAPVRDLAGAILLVGTIIASVVAVAAYAVTRQISGPILALTESATQIAAGDLRQTADIRREDEIGTLAQVFNSMAAQLQDLIAGLEQRVAERTRDLERRATQLETASQVARDAATTLDPDELLQHTVDLICERFGYYYASIFLIGEAHEYAVLRAAVGKVGQQLIAQDFKLQVGQVGMVGHVSATGQPRIALDVGEDAVHFDNPLLPDTRSEIALPLRARDQVLGVLDVQSTQAGAFSDEDIAVLQILADQVAVALDKARLYAESQESLETARRAYGELSREAWVDWLRHRPTLGYRRDSDGLSSLGDRHQLPVPVEESTPQIEPGPVRDATTMTIPIKARDQVIGVIDARRPADAGAWTADEIALLKTLIDQLGASLESARLFQDTQRRAAREQLLGEVTTHVRESLDLRTVLQTATGEMRRALGLERLVVRLGTPEADEPPQA